MDDHVSCTVIEIHNALWYKTDAYFFINALMIKYHQQ